MSVDKLNVLIKKKYMSLLIEDEELLKAYNKV